MCRVGVNVCTMVETIVLDYVELRVISEKVAEIKLLLAEIDAIFESIKKNGVTHSLQN